MRSSAKRKQLAHSPRAKKRESTEPLKEKSALAKEQLQDLSNNIVDVSLDLPDHPLIGGWSIKHTSRKATASNIDIDRYNRTAHILPGHPQPKRSETALRPRTSVATRSGVNCNNVYISQRPKCEFLLEMQQRSQKQPLKLSTPYSLVQHSSTRPPDSVIEPSAMRSPSNFTTEYKPKSTRTVNPINLHSPFKRNLYLEKWKHRTGRDTLKKLLYENVHNAPLVMEKENNRAVSSASRREMGSERYTPANRLEYSSRCKPLRSKRQAHSTSCRSNTEQSEQCMHRIEMRLREYGQPRKKYLSHMNKIHQLIRQEHVRLDTSEF